MSMYSPPHSRKGSRQVAVVMVLVLVVFTLTMLLPKKAFAYSTELVSNGGFESGASGWSGDTGKIGYNNVLPCHSGTQCVYYKAPNISPGYYSYAVSQIVTLPSVADSLTFSVWYWSEGQGGNVRVVSYDNPSDIWYQHTNDSSHVWANLNADLTAHKGSKAVIQLRFEGGGNYGPEMFDDASLVVSATDNTPPTTVATTSPSSPDASTGYFLNGATISLTASDNDGGSGVSSIKYKWDDAGTYSTFSSSVAAPSGIHTLYYYSIDQDGNSETARSLNVKVGTPPATPPVTTPTNSATNTNSSSNTNSGSTNTNTSTRNTNSTKPAVTKSQNANVSQTQTVTNVSNLTNISNSNTPTNIAFPDTQLANQNSSASIPVTPATVQAEKSPSNTTGYVLGTSGIILGIGFWILRRLLWK